MLPDRPGARSAALQFLVIWGKLHLCTAHTVARPTWSRALTTLRSNADPEASQRSHRVECRTTELGVLSSPRSDLTAAHHRILFQTSQCKVTCIGPGKLAVEIGTTILPCPKLFGYLPYVALIGFLASLSTNSFPHPLRGGRDSNDKNVD